MRLPPLTWVSLAFLAGLVLSDITDISVTGGLISLAGVLLVWLLLTAFQKKIPSGILIRNRNPFGLAPIILLVVVCLGEIRYQISQPSSTPHDLAWYNSDSPVTLKAVVADYPDIHDTYQLLIVSAKSVSTSNTIQEVHPVKGLARIRTGITHQWHYGDLISISGVMSSPSDEADFSSPEYLSRKSIYSFLYYPDLSFITGNKGSFILSWIYSLREKSHQTIKEILPSPESALLSGILLGLDNEIPESLQSDFRSTGTTHIIAISGFNISILAALFSSIFYRLFGLRRGALLTGIALCFYTVLAGSNASVIRAAIMGIMGIFASLIGRRQTGINSLAFTALVMCFIDPNLPWDVSFLLSFFSTLGLILFAEPITLRLKSLLIKHIPNHKGDRLAGYISEYFFYTLAALTMTLPIMVYYFHSLSWILLLTNPLILPAQPAVMILGGLALILGLIWLPLGNLLAHLAYPFISYTIHIVELFGELAAENTISLHINLGFLLLYYSILFLILQRANLNFLKRLIQPNMLLVYGLGITVFLWHTATGLPDTMLHIYILVDNPSESILIQSPEGRFIMIGGGSSSSNLSQFLGQYLPRGFQELDYLFLSPHDEPSIRSINHAMTGILIHHFVWVGIPNDTSAIRSLKQNFSNIPTALIEFPSKPTYLLTPGASLCLYSINNHGWFIMLRWDNFILLLPYGTVPPDWLDIFWRSYNLNPTVILLIQNGNLDMKAINSIRKLYPQLVILHSYQDNEIHPHFDDQGVIKMLSANSYKVIHFMTNGHTLIGDLVPK